MFDHVGYPVRDLAVSLEFYTRALKPLGLKLLMTIDLSDETGPGGYAGFGFERPQFFIGTGKPLTGRLHVAFAARDRYGSRFLRRRAGRWREGQQSTRAAPALSC